MVDNLAAVSGSDRRKFFRIDDRMKLSYRQVTAQEIEDIYHQIDEGLEENFTVLSSLAAISSRMAISMRRIEVNDADVATYLKALDEKIEVLGRAFLAQETDTVSQSAQIVNLSAGGMSLDSAKKVEVGILLELKLLLLPSFTGVLGFAAVVACKKLSEKDQHDDCVYSLSIEFRHMREQDRDILIKHVLRCQGEELKRRRIAREDAEMS